MINKTLLGLLCGSLGFGVSQLTVAGEVKVHSRELQVIAQQFKEEKDRTDSRVYELVGLLKQQISLNQTIIEQNRELLAHIRSKP